MKTILIVEDERVIAEILAAVLQDEGYEVAITGNGKEGLEYLQHGRPDLVLCDVMMPIIDGRDVARAMASNPEYSSIPLVMMSAANAPLNNPDHPYEAFVRKPFDIEFLLATISHILKAA